MDIRPLGELVKESFEELNKIQKGKKSIVRTGEEMIDGHIGGLLPGDIIVISGLPGHGKSQTLFDIKDNILSTSINPEAKKYVFLDMSLEMKVFNIVLRGVNKKINKPKKSILLNEFSLDEKAQVRSYFDSMQDDRQFVNQAPATPMEFYKGCQGFLDTHKDKDAVFITIDHMLLMSGAKKQEVLENTVEYINQLKLQYDNVYFILLSQLNRGPLERAKDRSNLSRPNASDLFYSSFMDQVSNYNIILYNAYKAGIEEYLSINPRRYDYLEHHFSPFEDNKGRKSFLAEHKIFFHVAKARESDEPYKDIFIKEMDVSDHERQLSNTVKNDDSDLPMPGMDDDDEVPF